MVQTGPPFPNHAQSGLSARAQPVSSRRFTIDDLRLPLGSITHGTYLIMHPRATSEHTELRNESVEGSRGRSSGRLTAELDLQRSGPGRRVIGGKGHRPSEVGDDNNISIIQKSWGRILSHRVQVRGDVTPRSVEFWSSRSWYQNLSRDFPIGSASSGRMGNFPDRFWPEPRLHQNSLDLGLAKDNKIFWRSLEAGPAEPANMRQPGNFIVVGRRTMEDTFHVQIL
ncbi:hypothetical protein DFH06DRAFT_1123904 [Mycena polygramma]|nr:hypothetical protein DFH06DRAFT_1123904 [Mycena polygramma]